MNRNTNKSLLIKISLVIITIILLGVLAFLAIRPLPDPSLENSEKVTGLIDAIVEEGGHSDIVFRLKGDPNVYYINRGKQLGLDPHRLMNAIKDAEVTIFYAKHWSLLNLNNSSRHITKVMTKDSVYYKEF